MRAAMTLTLTPNPNPHPNPSPNRTLPLAQVRAAFERYDVNGSGRLDYHELRAALQAGEIERRYSGDRAEI